jgi:hypothetical protein
MKAKPANMSARTVAAKVISEFFEENYQEIPVFFAGDFNEEP